MSINKQCEKENYNKVGELLKSRRIIRAQSLERSRLDKHVEGREEPIGSPIRSTTDKPHPRYMQPTFVSQQKLNSTSKNYNNHRHQKDLLPVKQMPISYRSNVRRQFSDVNCNTVEGQIIIDAPSVELKTVTQNNDSGIIINREANIKERTDNNNREVNHEVSAKERTENDNKLNLFSLPRQLSLSQENSKEIKPTALSKPSSIAVQAHGERCATRGHGNIISSSATTVRLLDGAPIECEQTISSLGDVTNSEISEIKNLESNGEFNEFFGSDSQIDSVSILRLI